MFCSNCGQQLADDCRFCNKCGHPVSAAPEVKASEPVVSQDPAPAINQEAPVNTPVNNPTSAKPAAPSTEKKLK